MAEDEKIAQESIEEEVDIFEEYDQILYEYRRRETLRNLTGIAVSLLIHLVLIVLGFYLIVFEEPESEASLTAETVEMEVKEIPPKQLEELEKLEQQADEAVPTVSKPAPSTETVEQVEDISTDVAAVDQAIDVTPNLSFKPVNTSLKMPGLMSNRTGEGRRAAGREFGIGNRSENAILKALRWLKEHQAEHGGWLRENNSTGDAMTGLALLAFLAHGDTPSQSKEFAVTVRKAIDYLVQRVEENPNERLGRAYTHGIVAYALCEAYAMTQLPEVGMAAENALRVVVRGQQPGGGFDYRYAKGDRWDMSVASWQFQAMKAGSVAGIELNGMGEGKQKGINWLKGTVYREGGFGYSSPGGRRVSMCSAAVLTLQLLGQEDSKEVKTTLEQRLEPYVPTWKEIGHISSYSWYYLTQSMFHAGRRTFKKFFPTFSEMLIDNQQEDGHWKCPNEEARHPGYAPTMNTALNCLSLQVAYRYLPSYKSVSQRTAARTGGDREEEEDVFNFDDDDLGISVQ